MNRNSPPKPSWTAGSVPATSANSTSRAICTSAAARKVKEFFLFPANYIWPKRSMIGEQLIIVMHLENSQSLTDRLKQEITQRNSRLLNYKRIHGLVLHDEDFPRTASLKIKRNELAERLSKLDRDRVILPL